MSFSKIDLDNIKNKILLSTEIQKKTKIVEKVRIFGVVVFFIRKKHLLVKLMMKLVPFIVLVVELKEIFLLYTLIFTITDSKMP